MGAIFLSHSSRDNATATEIAAWLKSKDFAALFLDFDPQLGIPPGCDWEKELQRQLDRCEAVIVLCSAHSVASQWCLSEVAIADHLGKPIFPVKISPCEPFQLLSDRQWIDFTTNPEEALERLARGLQVAGLDPANSFPWTPGRCPYPGLLAFEEADAAVFFGREGEISQGQQALRQLRTYGGKGLLLVLGASGCGKSSLVRAGLLPRLRRDPGAWLVLEPFRPRVDPFLELATSLAGAYAGLGMTREPKQIVAELEGGDGSGEAFAAALDAQLEELRRRTGHREASALVTVDQFEELLLADATAGSGSSGGGNGGGGASAKADRFLAGLRAALAPANGKLVVLGTLRSDFLGLLQTHPALRELPFEQLLVGPLGPGAYTRIIEGPARVAGVTLEPGLSERMVADTASGDAQTGDALPLLAFTLRELWEPERGLSLAAYDSLGGLVGSVREAADGVLKARTLNPAQTADLRQAFLAMTRINEQSQYCRRPALWSELPPNSLEILQRFVAARLLVSGKDTGMVEVAHEALLRTWDTLKTWLDDNRAFLLWRQRLEAALAEYASNGTLLRDQQLQEAESWRASTAPESRARQLIDASLRARKRQRFTRRLLAGAAVSALAAFAGGSWWQLRAIRAAQAAQFEATHRTLISSDPFMSVVYGLAVTKRVLDSRDPWAMAQLSQTLQHAVESNIAVSAPIATGQGKVISMIELKNGDLITGGADGTLRHWRDGRQVGDGQPIATGQGKVTSLIELMNGDLITGGEFGTLVRFRLQNDKLVVVGKPIDTHQGRVKSFIELRNGDLIILGDDDGEQLLRRWRWQDQHLGSVGKAINIGEGWMNNLIELKNGEAINYGSSRSLRLRASDNPLVAGETISTKGWWVTSMIKLNNGEVITGGNDGSLRRWRDGKPVGDGQPIATGQGGVTDLIELKSGELISVGDVGSFRRWRIGWRIADGKPIGTGQGDITSLVELKNGELISGGDGSLRRWRDGNAVDNGIPIATDQGQVLSLIQLKNGELISGGHNGTLRRWRDGIAVDDGKPINAEQGQVWSLIQLKNGDLVSGGFYGTLRRWRDGKPVDNGNPIDTGQKFGMKLLEMKDGELISGGDNGIIRIGWRNGEPVFLGEMAKIPVTSLIQLQNGDLIIGGQDGTLRRWRDWKPVGNGKPIATGQGPLATLIEQKNGVLISGGFNGTMRRWRDGKPIGNGQPIDTGHRNLSSLIQLTNGELISGGSDGTLRRWTPKPIARAACHQIDLASIPTDTGLGPVVEAAQATCRSLGVGP